MTSVSADSTIISWNLQETAWLAWSMMCESAPLDANSKSRMSCALDDHTLSSHPKKNTLMTSSTLPGMAC